MKKVFVYACLNDNLGDDLFIDILCNRYPNIQFITVCERDGKKRKANFPRNFKILYKTFLVDLVNKCSWKLWKKNIYEYVLGKFCKAIVYIGGSIFMEPQERKEAVIEYRNSFFVKNIPFFVIGANFGPYDTQDYIGEMNRYFDKCEDVCFRDRYSQKFFGEKNNVRYAPDVVFLNQYKVSDDKDRKIGISLIQVENKNFLRDYAKDYYLFIKKIIVEAVKCGYEIALLSFCEVAGDKLACQKVYDMLPENIRDRVEIYNYDGDYLSYLEKLGKLYAMIATRFHSMILGVKMKISTGVLSYDCKINQVINDLEQKILFLNISDISKIEPATFLQLLLSGKITVNVEALTEHAEKQFEVLDKYLNVLDR